jgi:hypothetical protein
VPLKVLEALRTARLREPDKLAQFVLGTCRMIVRWPSKAVPACAATSIERSVFPLAGSKAFSVSPAAKQT